VTKLSIDAAVSAWPGLEAKALRSKVAQVVGARVLPPETLRDLTLAMACALRHGPALKVFDALLREEVARVVRPIEPSLVDEVTQLVRERLFVTEGDTMRLQGFRGEAPLRAWVRAVALRLAINAQRLAGREVPLSVPPEVEADAADPELALLKARYRQTFREAFAHAISQLSPRARTVLRLYSLDGLTLARIGVLYRKDTSTVSRWVEQTRQALLVSTRGYLAAQLNLEPAALESLMRAADSDMSVSLAALLTEP
jgi:RNA polymerase sigma-70 factor (ECF subfamily)